MKVLKDNIFFAGSIGGKTGSSGGSIRGGTGDSGGSIPGNSGSNNSDCIVVNSLKKGEEIYLNTLREFRDETLCHSYLGKTMVRAYYSISPKLVKISERLPIIRVIVRKSSILIADAIC